MKNIILFIKVFLLPSTILFGQNSGKIKVRLINYQINKAVTIYALPNLKERIITKVKDDSISFNYYGFDVEEKKDSMIRVVAWSTKGEKTIKGWIKITDTGIYLRPRNTKYLIYEKPDYLAKYITIQLLGSYLVKVLDISDLWLKVEIKYKGKTYRYWLPKEYQCHDIYNSCT